VDYEQNNDSDTEKVKEQQKKDNPKNV